METAQLVILIAATVTSGLLAGLFYSFSIAVLPALRGTDDRTFTDVMQRVNVSILNGWFILGYVGSFLFTAGALVLQVVRGGEQPALVPTGAALVSSLVSMMVTSRANIPLNNTLAAAGAPSRIPRPAAVRSHFEPAWTRWNGVRAVLCTTTTGLLCWALIAYGTGLNT